MHGDDLHKDSEEAEDLRHEEETQDAGLALLFDDAEDQTAQIAHVKIPLKTYI